MFIGIIKKNLGLQLCIYENIISLRAHLQTCIDILKGHRNIISTSSI